MLDLCGDMMTYRKTGSSCFLLAGSFFLFVQAMETSGDTVGNGENRSPLVLGLFQKCLRYSVSIADRSLILFGLFQIGLQYSLATGQKVSNNNL